MEKQDRYKGELSREQLIVARNKIIDNAKSLYEEASLLYENKKYARAYFLLCIANEELGKSIIVTSAIIDLIAETIDWNQFWKDFRNHKQKTRTIEHMENIFVSSDTNFTDPKEIQRLIPVLEEMKMASLYSDMLHTEFIVPNEFIPAFMVASLHKLTAKRLDFIISTSVSDEALQSITKEKIMEFRDKFIVP